MDFSTVTHISYSTSGIDTDTIVQQLMQAEQVPLNVLQQKQQKDQWLSDAYRQWNTDLFTFNNNDVFNMKMSNSYDTFNVSSSESNAVTGTGTANAMEGTHTMVVSNLASAATLTGNTTFGTSDILSSSSLSINISTTNPSNSNAEQAGTVTIPANAKIADVVAAFSSAKDANGNSLGIQAYYDSTLQQFILKTNSTGAATKIDLSNNSGDASTFLSSTLGLSSAANVVTGSAVNTSDIANLSSSSINFTLTDSGNNTVTDGISVSGNFTSAQDYVNEINNQIQKNSNLSGKVTASLDQNSNLQFISTSNQITINNSTVPGGPANGTASTSKQPIAVGSNADITFDGKRITSVATNSVTLLGVNYTLNSKTDATGATISVNRDIDTEVKNIENFINSYNTILGNLNSALSEPVNSNYQPLTSDQKSQMTDTQITQWETQAKSGLMNNDSILSGLVTKMRSAMVSTVNNGSTYNSLASIGITSHSYQDQGKLYVNEDTLRTALQSDPQGVQNLFSQLGDGVGDQTGKQGVVQTLSDALNNAYSQLMAKAGSPSASQNDQSVLGKDLTSIQTQIDDMTTKLQAKEQSLYNQYDAMQTAVQQIQSQSTTLLEALGLSSSSSSK